MILQTVLNQMYCDQRKQWNEYEKQQRTESLQRIMQNTQSVTNALKEKKEELRKKRRKQRLMAGSLDRSISEMKLDRAVTKKKPV
jgi:predicted house-cleaning noncanonical NTP pyrophosphatase (MazG superfamily)